jgi:DNA polymerase I-like protein with 3'-5' exonuclease and polymerase domains
VAFDTMIASFLLNPLGSRASLDNLAYEELGVTMIPITELIGTGKTQVSFDQSLVEDATTYAAEDADMTWRLYQSCGLSSTSTRMSPSGAGRSSAWPMRWSGRSWGCCRYGAGRH